MPNKESPRIREYLGINVHGGQKLIFQIKAFYSFFVTSFMVKKIVQSTINHFLLQKFKNFTPKIPKRWGVKVEAGGWCVMYTTCIVHK